MRIAEHVIQIRQSLGIVAREIAGHIARVFAFDHLVALPAQIVYTLLQVFQLFSAQWTGRRDNPDCIAGLESRGVKNIHMTILVVQS